MVSGGWGLDRTPIKSGAAVFGCPELPPFSRLGVRGSWVRIPPSRPIFDYGVERLGGNAEPLVCGSIVGPGSPSWPTWNERRQSCSLLRGCFHAHDPVVSRPVGRLGRRGRLRHFGGCLRLRGTRGWFFRIARPNRRDFRRQGWHTKCLVCSCSSRRCHFSPLKVAVRAATRQIVSRRDHPRRNSSTEGASRPCHTRKAPNPGSIRWPTHAN